MVKNHRFQIRGEINGLVNGYYRVILREAKRRAF